MTPICERQGFPCDLHQVDLLPENQDAWNLFWDRKHLGELATQLTELVLTREEADDLLIKLRVLSDEVNSIEADKMKEAREKAKRGL